MCIVPGCGGHLEEKRVCSCLSCEANSLLSLGTLFLFERMMTVELCLLRPGLLTNIFLKMNEVNVSLHENN